MGFGAPSADDVYRYALRLDGRRYSLTDRFGWSLVMVGDYSPSCVEFLAKYCLDLCARTADRVRFVFFSNMSNEEFEHAAYHAYNNRGMLGTLGAVLERITWRSARFDYRVDPWDELLPGAFRPLGNEREILTLTAVPGVSESLRFAQKLGIGKHAPCIVTFTDIGAPRVHILPFAERGIDDVYRRVRGWIDEYYQINRETLDRWTEVEQEINRLAFACSRSLGTVNAWPESRRRDWQHLRQVAALISAPPTDSAELTAHTADHSLPRQARDVLHAVQRRIADLDEGDEPRRRLVELADALTQQTDHRKIRKTIEKLVAGKSRGHPLSSTTIAVLENARTAMRRAAPRSAEGQWVHRNMALFSWSTFNDARAFWLTMTGNDRTRRAYTAFRTALDTQPLSEAPEKTAVTVLDALAAHYGMAGSDPRWLTATDAFRAHLVDAIGQLQKTAPPTFSGQYIRDCLPERKQDVHVPPEAEERYRAECLRQGDLLTNALREDVRGLTVLHQGRHDAALASLPALLEGVRAKMEAGLPAKTPPELAAVDVDKLAKLAAALDDYDDVVQTIVYPHMRDPAAISVETRTSVSRAVHLGTRPDRLEAGDLRTKSAKAISDYRTAVQQRPSAEREAERNTPAGAFSAAVGAVLSPARKAEVGQHRTHTVLMALSRAELDGVARELGLDTVALTEDQARRTVLTGLGLSVERDKLGPPTVEAMNRLRQKMESNEFDAFIAYNTEDKITVLDVCDILRRHGVYPWIDLEQIQPGTWVQDGMESAIRMVRTAVVFVGPQGLGRWQKLEVRAFIDRCVADQVRVLPVLLPGVPELPEDLLFLRQFNFVRFQETAFETDPLQRMINAIL